MTLSILKLEKLLSIKGFIPTRYFVMHSVIVYMEIISITDADTFLLYIPSKYKFVVKPSKNVFKIKYFDVNESENNTIFDHYLNLNDESTKITIHKGDNITNDIHHMILSDIFIMSKSSLSAIVNYYRNSISIIREKFHHKLRLNTMYNTIDGNFTNEQYIYILNYLNLV